MIEELMSSLKSQVGEKVRQTGNFSTEKTGKIFSVIGDAAKKQVTRQMLTGNFSDVMNLFSKNTNTKGADNLQNGISSEVWFKKSIYLHHFSGKGIIQKLSYKTQKIIQ